MMLRVLAVMLTIAATLFAQTGKVSGRVFDKTTGEELIGANLMLEGTSLGAATDIEGNYTIEAPAGTYTLVAEYISYVSKKISGIQIKAGETLTMNIDMAEDIISSDVVVVEAKAYDNNINGLLVKQKNSSKVFDGISSEQIKKGTDSNIGAALKRVTGVSIVGGKNVFVRGLGNRYSNVQLNGSSVPSTNPSKKEVPLDIFPSNILDNIIVQKTYTADQPGEFSGGSVQMETKNFIGDRVFSISVGSSINSVSTFEDAIDYSGGGLDFLGFDDGTRKLPDYIDGSGRILQNDETAMTAFEDDWEPTLINLIPNYSVSITYGDEFDLSGMKLGLISSFRTGQSFSSKIGEKNTLRAVNQVNGDIDPVSQYAAKETDVKGKLTAMLNLALKMDDTSTLSWKNLFTNQAERSTANYVGSYYNSDQDYYQNVLGFTQETIFSSSMRYETFLQEFFQSKLVFEGSVNNANRYDPNRRNTHYTINQQGERSAILSQGNSKNRRFFSEQNDMNYEFKGSMRMKFNPTLFLQTGFGGILKDRTFDAREFTYEAVIGNSLNLRQDPNTLFQPDNFDDGLRFYEIASQDNNYTGDQLMFHGYALMEFNLSTDLKANTGVRLEYSNQKVNGETLVKNLDVLPAINLTYALMQNMNARAGFSTTVARPEFREISEFVFQDYFGGETVFGNPDIERTLIQNIDLRFELFPNPGEMYSVSGFIKFFDNPIEKFHRISQNLEVYFANVPSATLIGVEFEVKSNITDELNISGNVSLIDSEVDYAGSNDQVTGSVANLKRQMFGQSPYTLNLNLGYNLENTEMSLAYNTFGKRIMGIGNFTQGDDEYELPFHKLDFSVTHQFDQLKVKLSMQNLLNDEVEFEQNNFTTRRYKPGRDVGLSFSYSF